MKKLLLFFFSISLLLVSCNLKASPAQQLANKTAEAQVENEASAVASIAIPQLSYFQERRTIEKWAKFWDKPNLPTYIYVFMFDRCIGYFVSDGKPASTRSYLQPEQKMVRADLGESYGDMLVQAPDLDGTYGDNNAGIRFFTAEGNPVEVGGSGTSYIYSAYPLSLNVPKLVPEK